MPVAYGLLETTRVNTIMQALQDVRVLPQPLLFSNRIPDVPAVDSEVMARFTGLVTASDIIADDQKAVVYSNGKLTLETTNIPNIKHGVAITQEMLNMLASINAQGALTNDMGIFSQYERNTIDAILLGIRERKEAMLVAMALDAFSYSRLGIQITNASWGMPSDLKVTVGTTWDTAGSATPVSDILTQLRYALVRYGIKYDRITMSTQAFMYMIATTEFQSKVRFILPPSTTAAILPLQNNNLMQNLAGAVLGIDVELYDARYWQQASDGTLSSAAYLPITKVILSSKADDNDARTWDFANSTVTESIVSQLGGTAMFGSFAGPQRGPVAYATPTSPDMNPPGIVYWGVARGFPRKHKLQATSVLTVGAFSDTIPVGPPYV